MKKSKGIYCKPITLSVSLSVRGFASMAPELWLLNRFPEVLGTPQSTKQTVHPTEAPLDPFYLGISCHIGFKKHLFLLKNKFAHCFYITLSLHDILVGS